MNPKILLFFSLLRSSLFSDKEIPKIHYSINAKYTSVVVNYAHWKKLYIKRKMLISESQSELDRLDGSIKMY